MPETWLELAHMVLTLSGIGVLALLGRVLFELWLTLRQVRAEWMPRIRELLATTDETMASVEGMTRVAREQVADWSPLVTDARHAAEGVRDQATHVVQQVERSARHLETSVVRPLSREWRIWGHGLAVFGQHLLGTARAGHAEQVSSSRGCEEETSRSAETN